MTNFSIRTGRLLRLGTAIAIVGSRVAAATPWSGYVIGSADEYRYPVSILSTSGNITNAAALVGNSSGYATLSRPQPATPPTWPTGTTATASSYHAANSGDDGQPTTYIPSNAIDGNVTTFWNDDTIGAYPDVLTIGSSAAVELSGITVLSNSDGVPVNFTIDVWNDSDWSNVATIANNAEIQILVPFNQTISTTQVRITVTQDQDTSPGEYTRINEVYPGLVVEPAMPRVILDFGVDVVGYTQIQFVGASDNNPGIRLAFSETQEYLADTSDFTRSDNGGPIVTSGADQIGVPTYPHTWVDMNGCQNGTQVCADGLHGFRYLQITLDALSTDAPYAVPYGEVMIENVSLQFTAYGGDPSTYSGWFLSSDEQLNEFWYAAAYTNELVTDTFRSSDVDPRNANSSTLVGKLVLFDGAKRDRDPYVGDLAVSARVLYLTHNASEAARNVIADLADHQNQTTGWIPPASINDYTLPLFDYPLWWAVTSWDYVLYTADIGYAETYYPTLLKLLDSWCPSVTDENNLLSKGLNGTSGYGDYAFLPRSDEVTYYNALYVLALQSGAGLAGIASPNATDAQRWTDRAETVAAAINTYLWDSASGAYLDSSTGDVRHGQDGNSIAVLAGVANQTRGVSALDYLAAHNTLPYGNAFMDNDSLVADGSTRVYAFISYFEIQARFVANIVDSALDEIRRLYGWMYQNDPGFVNWEGIGANGTKYEEGYTSAAHGWSNGVLPTLTNYLLGILPTGPGFQTWTVQPHPGDVSWAAGQVLSPYGPLLVNWTTEVTGSDFQLLIDSPQGTVGTVSVPVGSGTVEVEVNGTVAWNGSSISYGSQLQGGYITMSSFPGGSHSVLVLPTSS